ncbi:iron-sulfur cluster assembly protein [Paenibacillus sp. GD4]|uniref:metal-sulfur cluster assembly factor n=1 Tax=Paenibacillus sp. GD4 TaxID=3068890 RepID=UPI0027967856|nr:iron-sulfur cluster assembly protein [Paenibacillus sp. GD4]MDQ1913865.1 iron-sulfur cluster assembly protein [Paenibacillus sp. GD4]
METLATAEHIREHLKLVLDPELGVNIVDLGLIYRIDVSDGDVAIRMTLTTPGCPLHDTIVGGVRRALEGKKDIKGVKVELVWEPRWSPEMMTEAAKAQLNA